MHLNWWTRLFHTHLWRVYGIRHTWETRPTNEKVNQETQFQLICFCGDDDSEYFDGHLKPEECRGIAAIKGWSFVDWLILKEESKP